MTTSTSSSSHGGGERRDLAAAEERRRIGLRRAPAARAARPRRRRPRPGRPARRANAPHRGGASAALISPTSAARSGVSARRRHRPAGSGHVKPRVHARNHRNSSTRVRVPRSPPRPAAGGHGPAASESARLAWRTSSSCCLLLALVIAAAKLCGAAPTAAPARRVRPRSSSGSCWDRPCSNVLGLADLRARVIAAAHGPSHRHAARLGAGSRRARRHPPDVRRRPRDRPRRDAPGRQGGVLGGLGGVDPPARGRAPRSSACRPAALLGGHLHRHHPHRHERQHLGADADRAGRAAIARGLDHPRRRRHRRRHGHRPAVGRGRVRARGGRRRRRRSRPGWRCGWPRFFAAAIAAGRLLPRPLRAGRIASASARDCSRWCSRCARSTRGPPKYVGGVAAITGSYLAGVLFAQTPYKRRIDDGIHPLTYSMLVPVFFISIGLQANGRAAGRAGRLHRRAGRRRDRRQGDRLRRRSPASSGSPTASGSRRRRHDLARRGRASSSPATVSPTAIIGTRRVLGLGDHGAGHDDGHAAPAAPDVPAHGSATHPSRSKKRSDGRRTKPS